jgi:integrase
VLKPWYAQTTEERPFLFGRGNLRPFGNWGAGRDVIEAAMRKGIEPWTLHDIRRTVATGMQRVGIDVSVIETVLGHSSGFGRMARVYQRYGYQAERQRAMDLWSRYLAHEVAPEEIEAIIHLCRNA